MSEARFQVAKCRADWDDAELWLARWAEKGWTNVVEMTVTSDSGGIPKMYVFLLERDGDNELAT